MKKHLFLSVLILSVAITACQAQDEDPFLVEDIGPVSPLLNPETAEVENCTVVSQAEAPTPAVDSIYAPVSEADWVTGAESPSVTFITYSDFQCPFCAVMADYLAQLQAEFPEDVQIVFRQFPLIGEPGSVILDKTDLAAKAAEAAGRQDQFWAMHNLLYEQQAEWVELTPEEFEVWLLTEAELIELDIEQFGADFVSEELSAFAREAWDAGREIGLTGTPTLLINDEPYLGPLTYATLNEITSLHALEKRQYNDCPPMVIDPLKQYTATIVTEKGEIVIELWPDVAPIAVNNFVFLAQNGWYVDVPFHRVLEDFMAQGGDPSGTGSGSPGYLFAIEISPLVTFDRRGLFAMANSGPTSNGSQFFITFTELPDLNDQFTIFGEVVEGMNVALSLTLRDPSLLDQPDGTLILNITIEEK